MATSVYKINKGINKPIEFKGLKAQYIGYLAAGLVGLLVMFAILYIIGINMFICLGLVGILGMLLFVHVHRLSSRFGQYGLMKRAGKRKIPFVITCNSRATFLQLNRI